MLTAALLAHYVSGKSLNLAVNSTGLDTKIFVYYTVHLGGRDSSVGIASRYWLDGPGIESQLGARFSAPVQTGPGAHPTYTMGTGSFPEVKRPGRDVDYPSPSSAEVEGRVELHSTPRLGLRGLL